MSDEEFAVIEVLIDENRRKQESIDEMFGLGDLDEETYIFEMTNLQDEERELVKLIMQ